MRIPSPRNLISAITLCAAAGLMLPGLAQAAPTPGPGTVGAVWVPKTLNFTYRGVTTHYTCNGLQDQIRNMLALLGARDVSVHGYGCINLYAPEPYPSVRIRMHVLEPAGNSSAGATVPARWQWADLLARRDPVRASADCELIDQFRQSILPLFDPRSIDFRSTCQPRSLLPGTMALKAEVLEPAQS